MNATANLTVADIEKLANFRSGLRKYLNTSHLYCEIFELTDLQYIFLLTVKALGNSNGASFQSLKSKLSLEDAALTMLIRRSLAARLLIPMSQQSEKHGRSYALSEAGSRVIETLAAMHIKEFEAFQTDFRQGCDTHCTSPVCWKGSD
jgi:hypothetical protein